MLPKTLSASSLAVASLCLARWKAEYLNKIPRQDNAAASLGTSVHGALEIYVREAYINKTQPAALNFLELAYMRSYMETFKTADISGQMYRDGKAMLERWFERTDFTDVTVLSVEQKLSFDLPYDLPFKDNSRIVVPFNYIMDRLDMLKDGSVRVVDYKSVRVPITPEALHSRIQARVYGLAAQIQFPDAPRIHVVFDLLRHDPVGIVFTREDNIATWKYLKGELKRIIETPEDEAEETLNSECRYCPVMATCSTLQGNIINGGISAINPNEAAELKYKLESQLSGIKALIDHIDIILQVESANRDELEWPTDFGMVQVTSPRRRKVNASQAAQIIGPDLMTRYGGLTVANVDTLLKGNELTLTQKEELLRCVTSPMSNTLSVKIIPASVFEE